MAKLILLLFLASSAIPAWADAYNFEIPEAKKSPYTLGGRTESRYIYSRHDEAATRYHLNAADTGKAPGSETHEGRALAELSAAYRRGILKANLLTHHAYGVAQEQKDTWDHRLYEGFISLTPTPQLTVDCGKRRILWGKGYAWNPVGFVNRRKDPDDPALNLEGRTLLGADLIKSFDRSAIGPTNLGLTALLLPVAEDLANDDLGNTGDLNVALKLYLLWLDTDIDLIFFDGPEQPASLGMDIAKNLAENVAVHGEAAWRQNAPRKVLDDGGEVHTSKEDQFSGLLGIRYLNTLDTTFIAEYYHNGAGYDADDLAAFFDFQHTVIEAWEADGDPTAIRRAARITRPYYGQRNFGRDYGYLKVSQKEPGGILYLTPWAAVVINLNDGSFNLQPGLTWIPLTNLELNLRVGIPVGPRGTEYGEKADAVRPEVWARYYF